MVGAMRDHMGMNPRQSARGPSSTTIFVKVWKRLVPERAPHLAMDLLTAQATRMPPRTPCIQVLRRHCVVHRAFRLSHKARHVRDAHRPAARAKTAHETLLRFPMHRLRADVARLPLRGCRARLDRDLHGRRVFVVGVVMFRIAATVDLFADLLVAAAPMIHLTGPVAVPGFAPHTSRGVMGQWRGTGGALCEDQDPSEAASREASRHRGVDIIGGGVDG